MIHTGDCVEVIGYTTDEVAGREAERTSAGKGWWPVAEAGLRGVDTPPPARPRGKVNFDAVIGPKLMLYGRPSSDQQVGAKGRPIGQPRHP